MKQTIKNFLFKKRGKILKNNKGLSLIEIMVVVGIIAVVAGIAIPQFNQYKKSAGYTALDASLTNVARAHNVCLATQQFSSCNDLEKIKISVTGNVNKGGTSPKFCADIDTEIGGETIKACVSVDSSEGTVTKTANRQFCFKDTATGTACATGNSNNTWDAKATNCTGDTLDLAKPCKTATASTDCPSATYGGCKPTPESGVCDGNAGTCS